MSGIERSSGRGRGDVVLRVEDLRKRFGDVTAVDGVSFDIERGTVVGLLGPNGAGKTTTIKAILGLVVPTSGSIEVAGVDVTGRPKRAYDYVGAMLEGARNVYWRLTVRENLRFFSRLAGNDPSAQRETYDRLLDHLALTEKADTVVNELSRGQKQKVSLATTLSRNVDVAFLDEPTLGLDVEASIELRRELDRLVRDEDMTVVLSSHDMDIIEELCDRVVILDRGRVIADDSVENLLDVFRTQAYRIAVGEAVPDAVRREVENRFDVTDWDETAELTRFEVSLVDGNDIRRLAAVLDDAGLPIDAVNTVEPDFEEVFLSLTNPEGGASGTGAADDGRATAGPTPVEGAGDA